MQRDQLGFHHDPPHEDMGVLDMRISVSGSRSVATRQFHSRGLKIIRPHYLDDTGQVYYTVVNPGGGYVGGDSYRIAVDVAKGASCLLTDQSATKVYRTPGDFVVQNIEFSVEDGGVLEYIPDQLILYRDADFRQSITARVHPGGSLFMSDIITPGWSPDGGQFLYKQAWLRTEVMVDDELAAVDNLRIAPLHDEFAQNRYFYLGGHTHVASVICLDPGITPDLIDALRDLIAEHIKAGSGAAGGECVAAISEMARPGFVLRALGERTEDLLELIVAVANYLRGALRGQGAVTLRKY